MHDDAALVDRLPTPIEPKDNVFGDQDAGWRGEVEEVALGKS